MKLKIYLGHDTFAEWDVDFKHVILTRDKGFGVSNEIRLDAKQLEAIAEWRGFLKREGVIMEEVK